MEELLVYALLLCKKLVTETEYNKRLDEMFLNTPESDDLLYLEWETDIKQAISYIRTHCNYNNLDIEQFGRILMSKLKDLYVKYSDVKYFAEQMYVLWESLPGNIQDIEPFSMLSYADYHSLSYGDEEQTRAIYEYMLNFYNNSHLLEHPTSSHPDPNFPDTK